MCTVSMIMDHYNDKWKEYRDKHVPNPLYPNPLVAPPPPITPLITKEEIEEFKKLLERAREYDKKHGEPNCELDEKKQALKKLAKELGVEIQFV